MSDKIIVLDKGKIVEYDDADKLFETPKDNYTKKLIKTSIRTERKSKIIN